MWGSSYWKFYTRYQVLFHLWQTKPVLELYNVLNILNSNVQNKQQNLSTKSSRTRLENFLKSFFFFHPSSTRKIVLPLLYICVKCCRKDSKWQISKHLILKETGTSCEEKWISAGCPLQKYIWKSKIKYRWMILRNYDFYFCINKIKYRWMILRNYDFYFCIIWLLVPNIISGAEAGH